MISSYLSEEESLTAKYEIYHISVRGGVVEETRNNPLNRVMTQWTKWWWRVKPLLLSDHLLFRDRRFLNYSPASNSH